MVNRSSIGTSVHWHGIELESYYLGVPGWSGDAPDRAARAAGRLVHRPPRAGTFIYHTHAKNETLLTSGMCGPLLVLGPRQTFDPATDHVLLFSVAGPQHTAQIVVNGGLDPALPPLEAGRTGSGSSTSRPRTSSGSM